MSFKKYNSCVGPMEQQYSAKQAILLSPWILNCFEFWQINLAQSGLPLSSLHGADWISGFSSRASETRHLFPSPNPVLIKQLCSAMDLALSDQRDSTFSLFGDAVESECFLDTQKQTKGRSHHFMLKHAGAPPPTRYRSLSVRRSARPPASSASAPCREPEPAVKAKFLWPQYHPFPECEGPHPSDKQA